MQNEVSLELLICNRFKRGATKEETFKYICQKCGLAPPPDSTICNWFERIHSGDALLEVEIGSSDYTILQLIICQFTKFTYAIFRRENIQSARGTETIIYNRFALISNVDTKSFDLLDTFNEQSRTLQTTINKPEQTKFYYPTFIDHDRLLLIVGTKDGDRLLLLNFDFDGLKCSILDEIPINFICYEITCDSVDNTKFLLHRGETNELTSVYKGCINNDRISIQEQQIEFGLILFCGKFIGDRFFAFRHSQVNENEWDFVEYDLSSNLARKVNEWTCISNVGFMDCQECVWLNNKLYLVCEIDSETYFSIVAFDSNTLTWSKTNFTGAGRVDALTIDDNEMLTVSTTEPDLNFKTVYRFPIRKPDKLRYLAWTKIRRSALFFRSKLYEKFLPNLPYNSEFRSFDG